MEVEEERLLANSSPGDDNSIEIAAFVEEHGLTHKLALFERAAQLLRLEHVSGHYNSDEIPGLTKQECIALEAEVTHKWNQPLRMYLCIVITAFGAMGQGWAQTGINGANLYYPQVFDIGSNSAYDTLVVGSINSGIYLSNGLLGSWLVAPLNDRFGRRGAAFIGAVISLVFNSAGSIAQTWQALFLYRLALGVGLAIITGTLNVFAAETAPAAIRGRLGVAWQMFCAFGIFVAFLTNMLLDSNREVSGSLQWRSMLLAGALPTIPLLGLIYLCPESPSWLIKRSGRYDHAFASFCLLRNSEIQAAKELLLFCSQSRKSLRSKMPKSTLMQLVELFTIPRIRRATIASYTTQLTQIMSGVNVVAFYSTTIFVEADFSTHAAELASTIFGLINFLGAFPAVWAMDSWGRRSLLLVTLLPMALTMGIAGIGFALPDSSKTLRFFLSTSMIYLFCLLYSPGMGPVPAAYSAEVFPLSHRELGMSSAVAVANLSAAALSMTFPYLLSVLGTPGSFMLYAILNVVAWVIVFLFVPETKGYTLEGLDEVFSVPTRTFIKQHFFEAVSSTRQRLRR